MFDEIAPSLPPIILEKMQVGCSQYLSAQVLHDSRIETFAEHLGDRLGFSLYSFVYAKHVAKDSYQDSRLLPADWRAHLRQHLLLSRWQVVRWWAGRKPVRLTEMTFWVDVTTKYTFPDNTIIFPDGLGAPHFYQQVTQRWDD